MLVRPMMTLFARHLIRDCGLCESTRDIYLRDVAIMFDLAEVASLGDLTRARLQGGLRLLGDRVGPRTVRRYGSAVRAFCRFLVEEELAQLNVGKLLRLPRVSDPEEEGNYFSEEEALALVAAPLAGRHTPGRIRDAAMLSLLYEGGLRASEVGTVKTKGVCFDSPRAGLALVPYLAKGTRNRRIPVESTAALLREYCKSARALLPGAFAACLFPDRRGRPVNRAQVYYVVRKWARAAGVEKAHPHKLRHSHATHLFWHGASGPTVQKSLGHKSLVTTSRYGHAGLKQQVEALGLHPLNRAKPSA